MLQETHTARLNLCEKACYGHAARLATEPFRVRAQIAAQGAPQERARGTQHGARWRARIVRRPFGRRVAAMFVRKKQKNTMATLTMPTKRALLRRHLAVAMLCGFAVRAPALAGCAQNTRDLLYNTVQRTMPL